MDKHTMATCDHPARSTRLEARILMFLMLLLFAHYVNRRHPSQGALQDYGEL